MISKKLLFFNPPTSPFADVINGWYLRRIRKGSLPSNDEKQTNQQQPFRFPAFEVIDIRPDIAPTNALDRLWLRVTAPHFNSQVDLKVSIKYSLISIRQNYNFDMSAMI